MKSFIKVAFVVTSIFVALFMVDKGLQAQVSPYTATDISGIDTRGDLTVYHYAFSNTVSATNTVAIPVHNRKSMYLQVFSGHVGSTTSAYTGGAAGLTWWVEGKVGTGAVASYPTFATVPIQVPASTAILGSTAANGNYGLYKVDIDGLAYVRFAYDDLSVNSFQAVFGLK